MPGQQIKMEIDRRTFGHSSYRQPNKVLTRQSQMEELPLRLKGLMFCDAPRGGESWAGL